MKSVSYDAEYDEKAGRVELFIRFFWAIPSVIVMMVLGLVAEICFVLQFLHILILGKRNQLCSSGPRSTSPSTRSSSAT
ncbi:Uncharacterised protein [uncultured archaeon]|nr:Uncharacterised protein [uncultured archaeon]